MTTHTALITGASKGIGYAIAEALAKSGYEVILLARNEAELNKAAKAIAKHAKSKTHAYTCDVSSQASVNKAIETILNKHGTPRVLVNNAGFGGPFHTVEQVSEKEWQDIFDTNIKSLHMFCKELVPLMKKKKHGRIINISSVFGEFGGAYSSTYAATKHAVIGFTKSLAVECGPFNITANAICPGFIDTPMTKAHDETGKAAQKKIIQRIPVGRFGKPEEIAALASFLASDAASYITGAALTADGGLSAHLG